MLKIEILHGSYMFDQSHEALSQQSLMSGGVTDALRKNAAAAPMPNDWSPKQNGEYARRVLEAEQRYVGDKYVHAIQTGKPFDLNAALHDLPSGRSPGDIHAAAATMENRTFGDAAVRSEKGRLNNGAMAQQETLEGAVQTLEKITKDRPLTQSDLSSAAARAMRHGLTETDVANYAQIQGIEIPRDVLAGLKHIKQPAQTSGTEEKSTAPTGGTTQQKSATTEQ